MKLTKNLFCSVVLLLMAAALATAHSDRGTITGMVTDPAGAVIPAPRLVLRNTSTGATSATQTTCGQSRYSKGRLSSRNLERSVFTGPPRGSERKGFA